MPKTSSVVRTDKLDREITSLVFRGGPLTKKQHHYFQTMCLEDTGGKVLPEWDIFKHLQYQDDERSCVIDAVDHPEDFVNTDTKIYMRVCFVSFPEELRVKFLRPKQRAFFEAHLPEVLRRFKQD